MRPFDRHLIRIPVEVPVVSEAEEAEDYKALHPDYSISYLKEVIAILEERERTLLPYGAHRGEWKKVKRSLSRFRAILSLQEEDERTLQKWYESMSPETRRLMCFRVIPGGKR